MRIDDLQRIRKWHVAHRHTHPIEGRIWDAVVTLWVAGWVGWLPVCLLGLVWCMPLLVFAIFTPAAYVEWRLRSHRARRLRCDWSFAALAADR